MFFKWEIVDSYVAFGFTINFIIDLAKWAK